MDTFAPANDPRARRDDVVFETVLIPHRSLPPIGFLAVMAALIGLSFAIGIGFMLAGAWPVIGFFGLDILLVYVVFRLSYQSARRSEHVRVTSAQLEVISHDGSGNIRRSTLQPYWARVQLEEIGHCRCRLVLRSHGQTLELGAFLGPDEKSALADALTAALQQLKSAEMTAFRPEVQPGTSGF